MSKQRTDKQGDDPSFDGSSFVRFIVVFLLISLTFFGSTDIEDLTNAPGSD